MINSPNFEKLKINDGLKFNRIVWSGESGHSENVWRSSIAREKMQSILDRYRIQISNSDKQANRGWNLSDGVHQIYQIKSIRWKPLETGGIIGDQDRLSCEQANTCADNLVGQILLANRWASRQRNSIKLKLSSINWSHRRANGHTRNERNR